MTSTAEIQAKHSKYVLSPWVPQGGLVAPVIVRGEGSYLFDADGKKYLDLGSGLIAVNLGHSHPKVVAAIQELAGMLGYAAPSLFHDKRAELGEIGAPLRDLVAGSTLFNDLRRGLPRLSPPLLSQRLKELEAAMATGQNCL